MQGTTTKPQGTTQTFYRRPLPASCIDFASQEGKQIFKEALAAGHMEGYFALAAQFHTQSEPAYCGLGTLCMVLNALAIDPKRVWKGPWRWFSEELLDCCSPLEVVKEQGITFSQFACLGRCNGATVTPCYASASDVDTFRVVVKSATKQELCHLVVCYHRGTLGQTGSGHFSPIGGYHPQRDLVLLMDVARFKYPPHWVSLSLLFNSMTKVDPVTNRSRGYLLLSSNGTGPYTFSRLKVSMDDWAGLVSFFSEDITKRLKEDCEKKRNDNVCEEKEREKEKEKEEEEENSERNEEEEEAIVAEFVRLVLGSLFTRFNEGLEKVFSLRIPIYQQPSEEEKEEGDEVKAVEPLYEEIHGTTLYKVIKKVLEDEEWLGQIVKETNYQADAKSLKEEPLLVVLVNLCLLVAKCAEGIGNSSTGEGCRGCCTWGKDSTSRSTSILKMRLMEDLNKSETLKNEVNFLHSAVSAMNTYCCSSGCGKKCGAHAK